MGRQEELNPEVVYGNVYKCYMAGDFGKALSNAKKIGRHAKDDKVAQECIAVCLLQLDRFEECLEVIEKKKLQTRFEKAYCLYRLNKTDQSLKLLEKAENLETREKELLCQIYYRLEKFDECIEVYDDLIKNVHDEHDEERLCNYAAALAAREQNLHDKKFIRTAPGLFADNSSASYEMFYNQACGYAACGDFDKAKTLLSKSIQLFTEGNADELSEEELNQELAVIRTQLCFVLQNENNSSEALDIYNQISKLIGEDPGLSAVVASNLMILNKSGNVFENKRKIKSITSPNAKIKLSSVQQKLIDFNMCLFHLHSNQTDAARKAQLEFVKAYPDDSELACLLTASVLVREKKYSEAISHLDDYPHLELLKAQVYIAQGKLTSAAGVLRECSQCFSLAVMSALLSIYISFEEVDSAEELVNEYLASLELATSENVSRVLKGISDELVSRELYERALVHLEKLMELKGPEPDILAKLIICSSKINPSLVKKYSANLPSIEELVSQCDVDELASKSEQFLMNKYNIKKAAKAAAQPVEVVASKKKKKKKRKRLPKNFDPSVHPDPERWVPKWDRVAFKRMRKKKAHDVSKGTQGGTTGQFALIAVK